MSLVEGEGGGEESGSSPSEPKLVGIASRSPMSLKDLEVATLRVIIAARSEGVRCLEDWGRCLGLVILVFEGLGPPPAEGVALGLEALDFEEPPPRLLAFGAGLNLGGGFVGGAVAATGTETAGVTPVTASWFGIWPS